MKLKYNFLYFAKWNIMDFRFQPIFRCLIKDEALNTDILRFFCIGISN